LSTTENLPGFVDTGQLGKLSSGSMKVPKRKSKTIYAPGSFEDRAANRCFACSKLVTVSIQRGGPASASLLKISYVVSNLVYLNEESPITTGRESITGARNGTVRKGTLFGVARLLRS
jgi:hypothetical protein